MRIRTLAVATVPALALAAGLATAAAARTASPDFRHACSAPSGWAECLALERTNVVFHSGILHNATPAGYGPAALRSAYNLTQASAAAGRGETVAVVEAFHDPNAAANLAVYRAQYHLPACTTASGCLRQVNQNGAASPLPRPAGTTGWAAEEAVDLDMVSAICPNCRIIVVEANNGAPRSLGAAVNAAVSLGARFVSNSYSFSETVGETADDAYYNHPGVVVTASSGDSGYGTAYPAASRYVTSVGGTSLSRAPGTPRGWSETAWNDFGATGSGCSAYEAKPAWQTDAGCSRRTENDVAADADPNTGVAVYDTYGPDRGWGVFGGTSVASPIIAATYALAGAPQAGTTPAEYPYQHTSRLYDVTSGTDGSCGGSYLCKARVGYDGPTGWGTPDGTGAFAAVDNAVTVASPGARRSRQGVKIAPLTVAARDSDSAQVLSFTASALPTGLSISARGAISGIPRAWGYYRVRVYATDRRGMAASASFAWAVTAVGAITSRLPGQCLDDWRGGTAPSRIDIYRCNHGRAQVWLVIPQPNGTAQLRLVRRGAGLCVTPSRRVTLRHCVPGRGWRARGGHLIDPRSGLCLTDPGAGPSGTQLELSRCTSAAAERWNLP